MKYNPLTTKIEDEHILSDEFKKGRVFGFVRLGDECLYFQRRFKVYYIPYSDIRRFFRRVLFVKTRPRVKSGNMAVENLVICGDEGELAQIQLPGTRAAKMLMKALKEKAPDAESVAPPSDEKEE